MLWTLTSRKQRVHDLQYEAFDLHLFVSKNPTEQPVRDSPKGAKAAAEADSTQPTGIGESKASVALRQDRRDGASNQRARLRKQRPGQRPSSQQQKQSPEQQIHTRHDEQRQTE